MEAARRIACLSLLSTPRARQGRFVLPTGTFEWDRYPRPANLELVRAELPRLLETYDCVALEGITSTFRIGDHTYRHEYVRTMLDLDRHGPRVSDGSGLQATLERYLVRLAAEKLGPALKGKSVLFLCGLARAGSAEVLSAYSRRLIFGDLLYGFRLGIPIIGYKQFLAAAPQLVNMVSRAPAQWFWPSARKSQSPFPRHSIYFRQSDVIVGDSTYFHRYAPDSLRGKIIFTNIDGEEDLALFRDKQARWAVSLSPVIGGQFVPACVLEAALMLGSGASIHEDVQDYYLNVLQDMDLEAPVYDLKAERAPDLAMAELPRQAQDPVRPAPQEELVLTAQDGVGKFCFVIHPLNFKQVKRLKTVRMLAPLLPQRLLEDAISYAPPIPVAAIRNIVSKTGARAEGILYAVPMTSKSIMRHSPQFLYRKLLQVAAAAQKRGCRIMGLGAYTSVVGDAGVSVSLRSPIGVTSGNSFTVAATLKTLRVAAERCGVDLPSSRALVIGATGSIGSICARLLACEVSELMLVSPRAERLLALSRQITEECPSIRGKVRLSRCASDFLPLADLIITTTSAVDPVVNVASLKQGAIVCDVARPPDIREEEALKRGDILVIESGEIRLPAGAELKFDIGLPPGTIYACLAETMLLALDGRFGHYTLGREIDPQRVQEIAAIGEKHGFELADIRSFGRVVPAEHFERLAQINAAGRVQQPEAVAAG